MVIISKKQVPQCSRLLVAQIKVCQNRDVVVKPNYEPKVFTKNINQLCRVQPLTDGDLEKVRATLSSTVQNQDISASEEWPEDMLVSRRDIMDFVEKTPPLGLEEAIKRNQRTSLRNSSSLFDYQNKQSVNIVYNGVEAGPDCKDPENQRIR